VQLNGTLRATALDPIFEGVGADASSIPSAILDALLGCPLDSRKSKQLVAVCGVVESLSAN